MSIWQTNPELAERAFELRDQGYSTREIAHELGMGISRNAVIGVFHRASGRKKSESADELRARRRKSQVRAYGPSSGNTSPLRIVENEPEAIGPLKEFPPSSHCKYIHGDPCISDWRCCGHETPSVTDPYCAFHARLCAVPASRAKRKDDELSAALRMEQSSGLKRAFG